MRKEKTHAMLLSYMSLPQLYMLVFGHILSDHQLTDYVCSADDRKLSDTKRPGNRENHTIMWAMVKMSYPLETQPQFRRIEQSRNAFWITSSSTSQSLLRADAFGTRTHLTQTHHTRLTLSWKVNASETRPFFSECRYAYAKSGMRSAYTTKRDCNCM